ncbi:hypothetical protein D3C87_1319710 [compost metagenome]
MIDDVALLVRQGAAGNAQVVEFAAVVLVRRHIEFEAQGVVWRDQFSGGALEQVLGFVG